MQITTKRIANGVISNYVNDILKQDDEILVFPPSSIFFKEPENDLKKYYFFFAGSRGITPVYSTIKTLLHQYDDSYLKLIYANHDEKAIIFKVMLENCKKRFRLDFLLRIYLMKY